MTILSLGFAYQITGNTSTFTSFHFTRKVSLSIDVGVEGHVLCTKLESVEKFQNMRYKTSNVKERVFYGVYVVNVFINGLNGCYLF